MFCLVYRCAQREWKVRGTRSTSHPAEHTEKSPLETFVRLSEGTGALGLREKGTEQGKLESGREQGTCRDV